MTSLYIFLASRCNICFAVSNSSGQKQKPSHDIRMDRCNMLPTPRPKAKALRIHSFLGAQLTRPGPSCQKMYPLLASRWIQASSPLRRRQCVYKACRPPLLLRVSLIHSFIHVTHITVLLIDSSTLVSGRESLGSEGASCELANSSIVLQSCSVTVSTSPRAVSFSFISNIDPP